MSNAQTVGTKLVELIKAGKSLEAIQELYDDKIVSVEAMEGPNGREAAGKQAVLGKNTWWMENHEVHRADVTGPFPHGEDRFALFLDYEVTAKADNKRQAMREVGVYTVDGGKVVREEFFYSA